MRVPSLHISIIFSQIKFKSNIEFQQQQVEAVRLNVKTSRVSIIVNIRLKGNIRLHIPCCIGQS